MPDLAEFVPTRIGLPSLLGGVLNGDTLSSTVRTVGSRVALGTSCGGLTGIFGFPLRSTLGGTGLGSSVSRRWPSGLFDTLFPSDNANFFKSVDEERYGGGGGGISLSDGLLVPIVILGLGDILCDREPGSCDRYTLPGGECGDMTVTSGGPRRGDNSPIDMGRCLDIDSILGTRDRGVWISGVSRPVDFPFTFVGMIQCEPVRGMSSEARSN